MNTSEHCETALTFGHRTLLRPGFLITITLLAFLAGSTKAADRTWDGGGANGNWLTILNWNGDVTAPSANDQLFFDGALQLAAANNFTATTAFNAITFNSGAGAFVLSGNSITLSSRTDQCRFGCLWRDVRGIRIRSSP